MPARCGALVLRHALAGSAAGVLPAAFGRVLRGALGLQLLGVEDAVASETAIGQRLRVVLKSVGRSFGSGIRNRQASGRFPSA